MSKAKVDEWLHSDKGKPWARASGGPVMDALSRRYAAGGSPSTVVIGSGAAPAASYLAGTAGSPLNASAVPTFTPAQVPSATTGGQTVNLPGGGSFQVPQTTNPNALNPQSGLMNVPQVGNYTLDPTTGALSQGTQQALQSYAQRGLPIANATPAATTSPVAGAPASTAPTSPPGTGPTTIDPTTGGLVDPNRRAAGGKVPGFAMGGMSMSQESPWWEHSDAHQMDSHPAGLIQGPTGGRADHVPMSVASGSYVVPADIVSGVGGGNTMAGGHALDSMMSKGPFGTKIPVMKAGHANIPKPPAAPRFARGGVAEGKGGVKVLVSHGEYIYPPHEVAHMGGGDLKHGHKLLDEWVVNQRKENVAKTAKLPGPVKS
jgi:hypothetical protein